MRITPKSALLAGLLASVAACGGSKSNEQAASSHPIDNATMSSGTMENATMDNAAMASDNTSATAPNPFSDSMAKMNQAMMSAVGSSAGDNWLRKMVAHHQGAIDMSKVVLNQNPTPEVSEMARMTIDKQGKQIDELKKLEANGSPDQKSADLYKPAMMHMQSDMMAASGSTVSETYMRKMLAHHMGAVAMSDIALKNDVSGAVKAEVQKTHDDQKQEADKLRAMIEKPS
ncbi:MAG: DUF305 domain-containing protein [Sphingomicrobium sp.]|nr:DUF305 domain-containing protein [Sphingomonadales bacterium]